VTKPSGPPSEPSWYYRPWSVVFLLFVVLGPFGLPLLWKSPSVSRAWKIVLTVALLIYTALLVESVVVTFRMVMDQAGLGFE
jgi:hypothetical protein